MSSSTKLYLIALGPFAAIAACVVILLALREQRWKHYEEATAFVKKCGGEYDVAPDEELANEWERWWSPPAIIEIRVGNRLRMRRGAPSTAARIAGSSLDDRSLRVLTRARDLERLDISHSIVSDAGVPLLGELASLRELYLDGTDITDDSIPALSEMGQLQALGIHDTGITEEGAARLKSLLPRAEVLSKPYRARGRP
jgi:hypothetical protein